MHLMGIRCVSSPTIEYYKNMINFDLMVLSVFLEIFIEHVIQVNSTIPMIPPVATAAHLRIGTMCLCHIST